jgi:hypothetical protein
MTVSDVEMRTRRSSALVFDGSESFKCMDAMSI